MKHIIVILLITLFAFSCGVESGEQSVSLVIPKLSKAATYKFYDIKASPIDDKTGDIGNPITVVECSDKTERKARFYLDFSKSVEYQIELILYSDKCITPDTTLKGRVTETNNRVHLAPENFEKIVTELFSPKAFFSILNQEDLYSRILIIGGADSVGNPLSVNRGGNYKNVSSVMIGGGKTNEVLIPEYKEELAWLSMKSILVKGMYYVMGGFDILSDTAQFNKGIFHTVGGATFIDLKKLVDNAPIDKLKGKEGFVIVSNAEGSQSIPMGNLNKPKIIGECPCKKGYSCNTDSRCELNSSCTNTEDDCPNDYTCKIEDGICVNNDQKFATISFDGTSLGSDLGFVKYPGDLTKIPLLATFTRYIDDNGDLYEIISGGFNMDNDNLIISNKVLIYKNCGFVGNEYSGDRKNCKLLKKTLKTSRYGHSIYIDRNNTIWVMGGIINCKDKVEGEHGDESKLNKCYKNLIVTKSIEIMALPTIGYPTK